MVDIETLDFAARRKQGGERQRSTLISETPDYK